MISRIRDEFDQTRVVAARVPAALVLLLGEAVERFDAQLLGSPANVVHIEKSSPIGELGRVCIRTPGAQPKRISGGFPTFS